MTGYLLQYWYISSEPQRLSVEAAQERFVWVVVVPFGRQLLVPLVAGHPPAVKVVQFAVLLTAKSIACRIAFAVP